MMNAQVEVGDPSFLLEQSISKEKSDRDRA